jgi:hypothetical protein
MFSDRPAPSEVGGLIVRRDLDNGPEGHQFHFLWLARDGGPFSPSRASFSRSSMALTKSLLPSAASRSHFPTFVGGSYLQLLVTAPHRSARARIMTPP